MQAPTLLTAKITSGGRRTEATSSWRVRKLFSPKNGGTFRPRKRKPQLLPLHFASSSRQPAKAGAFAYVVGGFLLPKPGCLSQQYKNATGVKVRFLLKDSRTQEAETIGWGRR